MRLNLKVKNKSIDLYVRMCTIIYAYMYTNFKL